MKTSFLKGHNGDIGAEQADLVLPGAAYTEKQGIYANMEGRAQQTLAAITPPVMARNDWQIVRAVSEVSNRTLPYENLNEIRQRLFNLAPNLLEFNKNLVPITIKPPVDSSVKENAMKISSNKKLMPLMKELADYYQTDIISRASSTMAKCVQAVNKEIGKRRNEKLAQKMK